MTTAVGEAGDGALKLDVVLEADEDGWVVASCPALPGCHSQGRTRDEALANIREAVEGYLASMGTCRSVDIAVPPTTAPLTKAQNSLSKASCGDTAGIGERL